MKQYLIPEELYKNVIGYIATKPIQECLGLFMQLQQLQIAPENKQEFKEKE